MADIRIKMLGRARITGTIKLISGLHIGAGKDSIEIGGVDNPVVKHPHTGEPYIPGSSLKGKLRFLLEWAFEPEFGSIRADGLPWGADEKQAEFNVNDPVLRIFGTAAKRENWPIGPTRLIVRDCFLTKDWCEKMVGQPLVEEKTEVVIDRIAGKAHRIGPRQTERVPAGAEFDMEMVFRLYDTDGDGGDRDRACLNWLLAGFSLLEQDALGGSGSRGYGRVRFTDIRVFGPDGKEAEVGDFRLNRFDPAEPPRIVTLS